MRIGILTFHSVDNFGAVLQAFALQTYLEAQGHQVEIVDYRPPYFHSKTKWPLTRPMTLVYNAVYRLHAFVFERFRRRHFNRTSRCVSAEDLERKLPRYDALVIGSDQVWSPDVDRRTETDSVYFARWNLPAATRKIGYAASFGTDAIPERHRSAVADGLRNIDVISVREESGVEIVRTLCGREARWVCDPVFLLTPEQWRHAASWRPRKLLTYMTYMPPESKGILRDFARREKGSVVLPQWDPHFAVKTRLRVVLASPFSWIRRIANSRGVITKSFHGVSFCLLMHAPFVYVRPSGIMASRATRVMTLLSRMGLQDRLLDEDALTPESLAAVLSRPTDWASIDARREDFAREGKTFLQEVLAP